MDYHEFLENKIDVSKSTGFEIDQNEINPMPYIAIKMGRYGMASELNSGYFADGVKYLESYERNQNQLSLFDFIEQEMEKRS